MNVKEDINNFSKEEDKPILLWLFSKYHEASKWHFVAKCIHQRYGVLSYEINRVWMPTKEGLVLYNYYKEEYKK